VYEQVLQDRQANRMRHGPHHMGVGDLGVATFVHLQPRRRVVPLLNCERHISKLLFHILDVKPGNTEGMDLTGKVTLVTGAGAPSGTGRAIALLIAREGAGVVAAHLDLHGARDTVKAIEGEGGTAAPVRADVRVGDDIERMVAFAERTFGGLDVLVNNAGATDEPHFPEATPAHWGATLDLNLRGPMRATQVALEAMRRRGGGAIVNVSSVAGLGFRPHPSPEYAAAKAGLVRFTATLAPLKERMNVRVNCVIPHWIETEQVRREVAAMPPEQRREVPKLLAPEQVAEAVLRLVRDDDLAGRVMVLWCEEEPRLFDPDRRE